MKQYFSLYKKLIAINFSTLIEYRANFVNNLLSSATWGFFLFLSMYILTSRSPSVYGWKRAELLFSSCGYSILIGIFHTLFSKNFEQLSAKIRYGELDAVLLKPIDSQFLVSFNLVNFTSIIRIVMGILLGWYIASILELQITPLLLAGFVALLFLGISLLYSIWFCVTTLLIYFPRMANIVQLMYSVTGMSRYPKEMYHQLGLGFFFVLPFTLVLFTPIRFLIQQATIQEVLPLFILSGVFFCLSRLFWKHALHFYTGASG